MERPRRPELETLADTSDTLAATRQSSITILPAPEHSEGFALPSLTEISLAFADPALRPAGFAESSVGADLVVTGKLGEGGTSTVYLAHQRQLNREVAIKIVRPEAQPSNREASLVAEALLTGSLEHPNIVPVHSLGCDATGRPLLVMKRIEGIEWRELIEYPNHPAWSREDLRNDEPLIAHLRILIQVANALEYAHSRGVIHRDVKPGNVMLGGFGEVYLVDWGVALPRDRPPRRSQLVGTPAYMAPEMTLGQWQEADARTDVYLLGATLHFVLTGRFRHEGERIAEALANAARSPPVEYGPDVPAELAALCNAATHLDKEKRPQSAAGFRQALEAYLRHRSSVVISSSVQTKVDELNRRLAGGEPLISVESAQRLAECQFGFQEALRTWSGNQLASNGLREVRSRMVERELELRNAAGARVLLADLMAPAAGLIARLDALEAEQQAERERMERAARAQLALDASVLWKLRAVMLALFLVGALIANGLAVAKEVRTGVPMAMDDVVATDVIQLLAVFLALAFTGRRLLSHSYNRRVIGVLLITLVAVTVADFVARARGVGSRTANLIDCVAMCSCFAIATVGVEPRWWRIVLIWVAAVAVAASVPMLANGAASMATVLTVLIGIWTTRVTARPAASSLPADK